MKRNSAINDELARRLRADVAAARREPSSDLHRRIMADVEASTRNAGRLRVARPLGALLFPRLLAAAALIALMATTAALFLPTIGGDDRFMGTPPHQDSDGATTGGKAAHPALVQPLRDAFALAIDAESPLEAEANRMLADAARARRLVLNRLPFRGNPAEFVE